MRLRPILGLGVVAAVGLAMVLAMPRVAPLVVPNSTIPTSSTTAPGPTPKPQPVTTPTPAPTPAPTSAAPMPLFACHAAPILSPDGLGDPNRWACQVKAHQVVYGEGESAAAAAARAAYEGCPPPLHGTFTLFGNRIPIYLGVAGPDGVRWIHAILDTGGDQTGMPESVLQAVGYRPNGRTTVGGAVPGSEVSAGIYSLSAGALLVHDNGQVVPLGRPADNLTIWGIPNSPMVFVGPPILRAGLELTTRGSEWTLAPPCLGPGK